MHGKYFCPALGSILHKVPLQGQQVAIQEYGIASTELYAALTERGAKILPVHVYKWEPPEDTGPLRDAISALSRREIDVVMFTSSVQIHHLFRFAEEMGLRDALVKGLKRAVVASIGPTTSGTLKDFGIDVDMEPSHPKMGFFVKKRLNRAKSCLTKSIRKNQALSAISAAFLRALCGLRFCFPSITAEFAEVSQRSQRNPLAA